MPRRSKLGLLIEKSRSATVMPLVIAAAASSVAACSEYKPETDTFSSVQADWSCVKPLPQEPAIPGSSGTTVVYTMQFMDLAQQVPVTNATVRACGKFDIGCDTPVTEKLMANELGLINIPLSSRFEGYLEIESPTTVPYIFHLPESGLRTMTDFPLAMISTETFMKLLEAFRLQDQLQMLQTTGSIGVRTFDCAGNPASGVELKSNSGGLRWYFVGGLPDLERTTTDEDGLGGYVGTDTGVKQLTAELPDGRVISRISIILRPLWMTAGYLKANPTEE